MEKSTYETIINVLVEKLEMAEWRLQNVEEENTKLRRELNSSKNLIDD